MVPSDLVLVRIHSRDYLRMPSRSRYPGSHPVKIPSMTVTVPVSFRIGFCKLSRRKNKNHKNAHAAQHRPNHTSHAVAALWSVSTATGRTVIATNKLNQPNPRPSAPLYRLSATQR